MALLQKDKNQNQRRWNHPEPPYIPSMPEDDEEISYSCDTANTHSRFERLSEIKNEIMTIIRWGKNQKKGQDPNLHITHHPKPPYYPEMPKDL